MDNIEFGTCEICGIDSYLSRKYFRYDIKCECHTPEHFEMVRHCNSCIAKEPIETHVILKTSNLFKYKPQEVKEALMYCANCEKDLGFMGSPEYNKQKAIIDDFYKKEN